MMANSELPWYKFFAADWLTSPTRYAMSAEERGIYRDVLDLLNTEGHVIADEQALARMLAVSPKEFKRSWPRVRQELIEDSEGRLTHPKARDLFEKRLAYREGQVEYGRRGGRPKGKRNSKGYPKGSQKGTLSKPLRVPQRVQKPEAEADKKRTLDHSANDRQGLNGHFGEWWNTLPRRVGKPKARTAYLRIILEGKPGPNRLTDLDEFRSLATFEQRHNRLMQTTPVIAAADWRKREDRYIPHPATFLNSGDWLTAPEPAKVDDGFKKSWEE